MRNLPLPALARARADTAATHRAHRAAAAPTTARGVVLQREGRHGSACDAPGPPKEAARARGKPAAAREAVARSQPLAQQRQAREGARTSSA